MNILIIGAGAIGCLVGGKLAHSGQRVTFGSRPRFVEAVRAQGLTLIDESGRHVIDAAHAEPSIEAAFADTATPYDLCILTVKSYDTPAVVEELAAVAQTGQTLPPVLSLQNGVGNEETLARGLPQTTILAGVITTPVSVPAPAVVQVDRPSYTLGLSVWRAPQQDHSADLLLAASRDVLLTAGFRVRSYPHAQGLKWTKLLMNMMGNALCAILDLPPDRVFLDARLADLEVQAWREALAVMHSAGIPAVNLGSYRFAWLAPLIRHTPKAWLRPLLRAQVGKARGEKLPSLQLDLRARHAAGESADPKRAARTEVLWLNGAVTRKGRELKVPTPVNDQLTSTLAALFADPSGWTAYRHNPERLLAELAAG